MAWYRMTRSTCDLYDQFAYAARVLPPLFQDFGGRSAFGGEVVTVKCFEDNSRVKELVATTGKGKVLVVDGGGSTRCALMGDVIAREAVVNGWEGVVIFGCIRDRAALKTLNLGVKALGSIPRKSVRLGEGQIQLPVMVAGVWCEPGDVMFADEDGVLLLDSASAARAL
jgi:regulator of ribonuclease activity A